MLSLNIKRLYFYLDANIEVQIHSHCGSDSRIIEPQSEYSSIQSILYSIIDQFGWYFLSEFSHKIAVS